MVYISLCLDRGCICVYSGSPNCDVIHLSAQVMLTFIPQRLLERNLALENRFTRVTAHSNVNVSLSLSLSFSFRCFCKSLLLCINVTLEAMLRHWAAERQRQRERGRLTLSRGFISRSQCCPRVFPMMTPPHKHQYEASPRMSLTRSCESLLEATLICAKTKKNCLDVLSGSEQRKMM
jgi:hypothetical protein